MSRSKQAQTEWAEVDAKRRQWAREKTPLTVARLAEMNKAFAGEKGGTVRTGGVYAGGVVRGMYSHQLFVQQELDQTLSWLDESIKSCEEGSESPIVVAAKLYKKLASIHPFADGNGRTARMAMDYVLERFDLPPASMGQEVSVAVFALQIGSDDSPDHAIQMIIEGIERSYRLLEEEEPKQKANG